MKYLKRIKHALGLESLADRIAFYQAHVDRHVNAINELECYISRFQGLASSAEQTKTASTLRRGAARLIQTRRANQRMLSDINIVMHILKTTAEIGK